MYISCTEGKGILYDTYVYEFFSNSEFVKMELLCFWKKKNKYPLLDIKVSILNSSTWKIDLISVKISIFLTSRDNNDEF